MSAQTIEQELIEFKAQFYDATKRKDREALEKMIHDDFSFIDPEGQIVDKAHCLYSITHPNSHFTDNFKREEKKVSTSVNGNTVTEVADVELIGTLKGEDRTGAYINTATYVKGPDGWQMLGNTLRPR
jgi:ketosteroid isomerase-like protein